MTQAQMGTVALVRGDRTFPSFAAMLDVTVAAAPHRDRKSLRPWRLSQSKQLDDGTWTWRYDSFRKGDGFEGLWDDVPAITMPTTLVRGAKSFFVNDEDAEAFAKAAPGFQRTHVVADSDIQSRATSHEHSSTSCERCSTLDPGMCPFRAKPTGRSAGWRDTVATWPSPSQHPIRIGVQLQPQHSPQYSHIREAVRRCEDIGVDAAFNWDHFFPLYGDPDGPHYECWTMLGAWPSKTSRLEIGALVTCNSYRNPELLADMARTVDHISEGRLILGIGSGLEGEGLRRVRLRVRPPAGGRLDDLAAGLPRIKSRLAKLNPPPTRDIPILIGGQGERKTLRLVAEYADIWHGFTTLETYPAKAEILARRCADIGRDPATIERSAGVQGNSLDALLAEADAFVELGVTMLTVGVNGPDYDLTQAEALCRWRDRRQQNGN